MIFIKNSIVIFITVTSNDKSFKIIKRLYIRFFFSVYLLHGHIGILKKRWHNLLAAPSRPPKRLCHLFFKIPICPCKRYTLKKNLIYNLFIILKLLSLEVTVIKITIEFLMKIMILTVKFRQVLTQFLIIYWKTDYPSLSTSSIIFCKTPPSPHIIQYHLFTDPPTPFKLLP
jgi:hypothetical protein